MIIMESAIAMNNDYVECTNTLGKIELFAEAAYKEYEINLKEVALKVLKENGTEDDFDFLATEAAAGYIERAKKAIERFIEAIKKFIRNCKDRLVNLVTNIKTSTAIDKAEEACKKNPKLRSMKIEYQNTDKHVGILQQGIDRIRKRTAKVKAKGVATDNDIEEIEKIKSDITKKLTAISAIATVTLGTAIAIFKNCNSRTEIDSNLNEDGVVSDCSIEINEDSAKTALTADYLVKSAGTIAELNKEIVSKKVVKSTSLLNRIKKAISISKGKIESEDLEGQAHESTLEDLRMFSYVAESVEEEVTSVEETVKTESVDVVEGLDLNKYFTELCDDLFTNNVTESTEESEEETTAVVVEETEVEPEVAVEESVETEETPSDAVVYLEQLEHEIFGDGEEVATESTEEITETTDATEEVVTTESAEEVTTESLLNEMEALLL